MWIYSMFDIVYWSQENKYQDKNNNKMAIVSPYLSTITLNINGLFI